jgi:hypothetical protein
VALSEIESLKRSTLTFVNRIRKELGLKAIRSLEKGRPGFATACPITRSIEKDFHARYTDDFPVTTTGSVVFVTAGGIKHQFNTPPAVHKFVDYFDRRWIDDLVSSY